jgi:hypothetical protein
MQTDSVDKENCNTSWQEDFGDQAPNDDAFFLWWKFGLIWYMTLYMNTNDFYIIFLETFIYSSKSDLYL